MHREPERVAGFSETAAISSSRPKKKGLDTGHGMGTAVAPIVVGELVSRP